MSQKSSASITWPLVGLAGVGGAFVILVLVVIPKDDTQSRSAILGALVTIATSLVALFVKAKVGEVREGVEEVDRKVNGRMTQMLAETAQARDALLAATAELERERAKNAGREP